MSSREKYRPSEDSTRSTAPGGSSRLRYSFAFGTPTSCFHDSSLSASAARMSSGGGTGATPACVRSRCLRSL